MKVTFSQVELGLITYIDREIAGKVDGLKKLFVVGAEALVAGKFESIAAPLLQHKLAKELGIVDDQKMIDLDALKTALTSAIDKTGPVTQDIPFLGPVTFKREDVDMLYNLIRTS